MSHGRRTMDRRRRVLYSAHQSDQNPPTAASRREAARLREARRPPEAYGSRVHRRLRARWFSLVPVKRGTMILFAVSLASVAVLLSAAHYMSVAWPSIAYRPEIARPLRLDRPDSFGRWLIVAMLGCSAGTSFLIYQLRRYRNDDFKGQYRLWRLALIVMAVASVNAVASIIDWSGALLDAGFGKRVALTGGDWLRLIILFGGAVLAIRMLAEVRRCRFALGMMAVTCGLMAIPEAARWNVLEVDSLGKWVMVTSAPLLGCTTLFISLVGYLRMLYREVRRIEGNVTLRERFQQMRLQVFQRSDPADAEEDDPEEELDEDRPRRRWWRRRDRVAAEEAEEEEEYEEEDEEEYEEDEEDEEEIAEADSEAEENAAPRTRRRWFGLRRPKAEADDECEEEQTSEAEEPPAPKKRRRFSMRLSPPGNAETDSGDEAEPAGEETADEPKRRGLGGWLRSKKNADAEPEEPQQPEEPPASTQPQPSSDDEEFIDPDEIDWSSLSKSERRRLRKKLKRQNRAA